MSYGYTTVQCMKCGDKNTMYGFMPTADMIWYANEGLMCCGQQTHIIKQVKGEKK